jgi:hypothetical protein
MTDYDRGFRDAKDAARLAIAAVEVQTGHQPDRYSEWVWTDRRAADVRQDCLDAVAALEPHATGTETT